MRLITWLNKISNTIYASLEASVRYSEHQIVAVGLVGFVGFPLYYFVWHDLLPQPYENLGLRLLGSMLCMFLIFKDSWPKRLKPFLPIYWYITICYSLSFFFSYMLLRNEFSPISVMSMLVALFLLVLILDWIGLTILALIGFILAWVCYTFTAPSASMPIIDWQYIMIYLFTIIAGSVFNYKTALLQSEKLQGMSAASGSIAHELRTPLLGIKSGAAGLKRYLPTLFKAYELAQEHGLPITKIRGSHFQALLPILERIDAETNYANTIIDMLLMNVGKQAIDPVLFEPLSIVDCVTDALKRYPFNSESEFEKVHFDKTNAFEFKGAKLLMVHVLFNLLKNALYFIRRVEKGEIYIWLTQEKEYNVLHFKDTGQGIPAEALPKLFVRFFSTTHVGTGIGLSFCKLVVESFEGEINCESIYGQYTEFLIRLPIITALPDKMG